MKCSTRNSGAKAVAPSLSRSGPREGVLRLQIEEALQARYCDRRLGLRETGARLRLAHRAVQLDVGLDDPLARLFVRLERPDAFLGRPAERDAVAPGHHVNPDAVVIGWPDTSPRSVIHLGLRHQVRELPLDRDELRVAEQVARPEPRAVDDERLAERHEVARCVERADDQSAAKEQEVTDESVEINRWLNPE